MKYMNLNSKVVDARWVEEERQWQIQVQKTNSDTVFTDKADILINASGVLKYAPKTTL
jgi:cation diffusion facilitator CzcD-associated flavoprotein CzcO